MQQHKIRTARRTLGGSLLLGGALALAACGGGSSSSGSGSLTLGITDGPVEEADNVFVQFSKVTLKPSGVDDDDDSDPGNGDDNANGGNDDDADDNPAFVTIEFDEPKRIDLLDQQNGNSALLVENESIPAGDYDWVRLGVDLGPGETVIVIGDTTHDLFCPSCDQTGLKLVTPFSVESGGTLDLTIDFDLRKSVVEAPGKGFILKPALRLVNNDETGEIAITATGTYVANNDCGTNDGLGEPIQSVYVYEGEDVTPDDVNTDDDSDIDPVTTAMITDEDGDGTYTGTAAFLPAGDYTVAYVCDAEDDVGDADDSPLTYSDIRNVEVEAGETDEYNLP